MQCAPAERADGERYVGLLAALDAVGRGDVVVVASGPSDAAAVWGELLSNACISRGAVGTVTDGLIRDSAQIAELGYPVFARGTSPLDIHGRLEVVAHGGDGVVVVPQAHAAEALERAAAKAGGEGDFRKAVSEGATATEAFRRFHVL